MSDTLPFETSTLAATIAGYLQEVMQLADTMRADTEELNRELRDRTQLTRYAIKTGLLEP